MAPEDFERWLETLTLPKLTDNTITSRKVLRQEVEKIRDLGVAYDDCELDIDVRCVAMPVRDFTGRCVGAMGLSGPAWRLSTQSLKEISRHLSASAADLSAQLGFAGVTAPIKQFAQTKTKAKK